MRLLLAPGLGLVLKSVYGSHLAQPLCHLGFAHACYRVRHASDATTSKFQLNQSTMYNSFLVAQHALEPKGELSIVPFVGVTVIVSPIELRVSDSHRYCFLLS